MTSVDPAVLATRLQAVNAAVSSLGPALEAAAPSGQFQTALDSANAALAAAADPSATAAGAAAGSTGGGTGSPAVLTPTSTLLGLTAPGTSSTPAVSGAAVVADAVQYLGVPYRWGGTDPSTGLDCSGLVQRVYGDLGMSLPRTSEEQATVGAPVASLAQAQPGDLVFFEPAAGGPGHVGIYVGDGRMIDAPHTGTDVQVQGVGDPVAIRRVLPGAAPGDPSAAGPGALAPTGSASGADPAGVLAALGVPAAMVPLFSAAASQHGVPVALLAAVAKQESGFDPRALSPAGAEGLMQLMPSTAAGLGVDPFDPAQAVGGAARLLGGYLQQYGGSVPLTLAAYNAGPGAVARYGGVPPYPETTAYVNSIVGMIGATS